MKKRIASVLVALVMVLSLVPKTSWAWTSTVTTLEQLKSAISELSYNNTIEIVVSGTIEISETLNIRPTRTTNGSMAWYEYYNQRVVISGADANSKLVRAEGFKGSLFNLRGEQGYSGAGGSDHPAYATPDPEGYHRGRRRRQDGRHRPCHLLEPVQHADAG